MIYSRNMCQRVGAGTHVQLTNNLPAQRPAMPSKSTPSQHGHVDVHGGGAAASQQPYSNAYRHQHATRRPSHRAHGTRHRRTTTAKPTYHNAAFANHHGQESIVRGTDTTHGPRENGEKGNGKTVAAGRALRCRSARNNDVEKSELQMPPPTCSSRTAARPSSGVGNERPNTRDTLFRHKLHVNIATTHILTWTHKLTFFFCSAVLSPPSQVIAYKSLLTKIICKNMQKK